MVAADAVAEEAAPAGAAVGGGASLAGMAENRMVSIQWTSGRGFPDPAKCAGFHKPYGQTRRQARATGAREPPGQPAGSGAGRTPPKRTTGTLRNSKPTLRQSRKIGCKFAAIRLDWLQIWCGRHHAGKDRLVGVGDTPQWLEKTGNHAGVDRVFSPVSSFLHRFRYGRIFG